MERPYYCAYVSRKYQNYTYTHTQDDIKAYLGHDFISVQTIPGVFAQIMGDEGTITIGSISQTDNIYFYDNKGVKTELVPDIDKKYHMGNEAQSAYNFITDFQNNRSFYNECRKLNENVLECMEKMRINND